MRPQAVWALGVMSQEFQGGPRISQPFADILVIEIDHELEDGSYAWQEMRFVGVVSHAFTFAWSTLGLECPTALDEIQVYAGSTWPFPVRDAEAHTRYVMFFDDFGCFEVLAREFVPPPSAYLIEPR